jgi:uncharacterized cupredoxin-like copper-binding protein
MDDAIEVDATVAPEGDVRFAISNRGERSHEFVIATVRADGGLPLRDGRVREDDVEVVGRVAPLAAGASHDAVVQLRQGQYMLFSNTEGDFQRGLHAELTVQPPEPFDADVPAGNARPPEQAKLETKR